MRRCVFPKDHFDSPSLPDFSSSQAVSSRMVSLQKSMNRQTIANLNLKIPEYLHHQDRCHSPLVMSLEETLGKALSPFLRSMTIGSSQTSFSFVTMLSIAVLCTRRTRKPVQYRSNGWMSCAPRQPASTTWTKRSSMTTGRKTVQIANCRKNGSGKQPLPS